jgi:hypothetical protein
LPSPGANRLTEHRASPATPEVPAKCR